MKPTLTNIKERICEKVDAYFDAFAGEIRKQMQDGHDVTFRFSAKITDEAIEYSAAVGYMPPNTTLAARIPRTKTTRGVTT